MNIYHQNKRVIDYKTDVFLLFSIEDSLFLSIFSKNELMIT